MLSRHCVGRVQGRGACEIYLNRGVEHKNKSDLDSAIADYGEAIKVDPRRSLPTSTAATPGRPRVTRSRRRRLQRGHPARSGHARAYNNRGVTWSQKGAPDRAIADYNEGIRLDPTYAVAHNNRGNAWRSQRRH